jgi:hypothetical protein
MAASVWDYARNRESYEGSKHNSAYWSIIFLCPAYSEYRSAIHESSLGFFRGKKQKRRNKYQTTDYESLSLEAPFHPT